MAIIKTTDNVLSEPSITVSSHGSLIDYLQEVHPNGFNQPVDVFLNNVALPVDKFDTPLADDDEVTLIFKPAAEIAVAVLVSALVSTAVAYIFAEDPPSMPQIPSQDYRSVKNPQSVYSLNANQNQFGAGQTIPVIYGSINITPSLIAPPYRLYDGNEEFLYQLMCLGVGDIAIDDVLIADASSVDIRSDAFDYQRIRPEDLTGTNVTAFIQSVKGDTKYTELVNTVKVVENLEIRGKPSSNSVTIGFSGVVMTFYPFANGDEPDLSSLVNGSEITITNAESTSNNGTYIVDSVTGNAVTIGSKVGDAGWTSFTTTPTGSSVTTDEYVRTDVTEINWFYDFADPEPPLLFNDGDWCEIIVNSVTYYAEVAGSSVYMGGFGWVRGVSFYNLNLPVFEGVIPLSVIALGSSADAEFDTTYGSYTIAEGSRLQGLKAVELDFDLPRGLYNSSGGVFADRTVNGTAYFDFYYSDGTKDTFGYPFSYTDDDNSPIRKTFKPTVIADELLGTHVRLALRIKRDSAEPSDTSSQDKIYLQRVKGLFANDYGNQDFGDVTLLWTRTKATNAISALGQTSIHARVTRSDVGNTVADVITDIVTNTDYGAGLPSSILDLPTTTETINGAYETEVTVAEALRVAGNAGRYEVKQSGDKITIAKDEAQTNPVALFNETNIIKDSLVTTYNIGQVKEIDGYRVLYRDPDTFQEAEEIYPATSVRPEVVELWGVTSSAIALAEATYLWKKYIYKRNQVEFQTDYEGYIPNFNDKIVVSHNIFKNSQASEVVSDTIPVSGTREITLADEVIGTPNQLLLRGVYGAPEEYTITAVNGNVITVTMADSVVLFTDFTTERTKVSLGTADAMSKEYTITSIKPSKENVMTISAVNYDSRVYS